VCQALDEIRQDLPFLSWASSRITDRKFINGHLYCYAKTRPKSNSPGTALQEGRHAHIEQKNWTHVRNSWATSALTRKTPSHAINDLYRNELRWFQNFFQPSLRLVRKVRIGSRLKREYDLPKNPLERVSESGRADMAS